MVRRPRRSTSTDTPFPTRGSCVLRRCLVLQLLDLVVDLLERTRGGQDILGVVARIVDDPADLRRCRGDSRNGRQHDNRAQAGQRRSEEQTSELQSLMRTSYSIFNLDKITTYKKN